MNNKQFNLDDHSWFIRVNTEDEFNYAIKLVTGIGFSSCNNLKYNTTHCVALGHDVTWNRGKVYQATYLTVEDTRFKEVFLEELEKSFE